MSDPHWRSRYDTCLDDAFHLTWQQFQDSLPRVSEGSTALGAVRDALAAMELCRIDGDAIGYCRQYWEPCEFRKVAWDWGNMVHREPKRFSVAIWCRGVLCGLASGPTKKNFTSIALLEGNPAPHHPMKGLVIPVSVAALDWYGTLTGKRHVYLKQAVKPLWPNYAEYGFEHFVPPQLGCGISDMWKSTPEYEFDPLSRYDPRMDTPAIPETQDSDT